MNLALPKPRLLITLQSNALGCFIANFILFPLDSIENLLNLFFSCHCRLFPVVVYILEVIILILSLNFISNSIMR